MKVLRRLHATDVHDIINSICVKTRHKQVRPRRKGKLTNVHVVLVCCEHWRPHMPVHYVNIEANMDSRWYITGVWVERKCAIKLRTAQPSSVVISRHPNSVLSFENKLQITKHLTSLYFGHNTGLEKRDVKDRGNLDVKITII